MKKLFLGLITFGLCILSINAEEFAPGMERYKMAPYKVHTTKDTKWIDPGVKITPYHVEKITGVYDDVFGCLVNNLWVFYNINGHKIFDTEWGPEYNRGEIKFSDGVCMMFDKDRRNLYLLRKDGTFKKLPGYYSKPTNYVDGIAMVYSDKVEKYVYLNTEGEEIYKNIKFDNIGGYDAEKSSVVPPLKDGLRLYKDAGNGLFGYFDKDGNIKIKPQFVLARSFSDGLALVKGPNGPLYFIDTNGNRAFNPAWDEYTQHYNISDFSNGFCVYYSNNGNFYYDKKGVKVMELPESSIPFYGGYAWYSEFQGGIIDNIVNIRQEKYKTDLNIQVTTTPITPDFSPAGIAITQDGHTAFTPNGHILIEDEDESATLYWFSPDYISKAQLRIAGEDYLGYVNQFGEVVVVLK